MVKMYLVYLWCFIILAMPVTSLARATLNIAVSTNFVPVMRELSVMFESKEPVSIELISASSGKLYHQIRSGLPVDIFLSADAHFIEALVQAEHINPKDVLVYANGIPVLVMHKRLITAFTLNNQNNIAVNTENILSKKAFDATVFKQGLVNVLALLKKQGGKIALANPSTAPYGRAAKQALNQAQLWPCHSTSCVTADNVARAFHFVHTGAADAAFVAQSFVVKPLAAHLTSVMIPPSFYKPIIQTGGVLANSQQPYIAQRFMAFLHSKQAQTLIKQYGYDVVKKAAEN